MEYTLQRLKFLFLKDGGEGEFTHVITDSNRELLDVLGEITFIGNPIVLYHDPHNNQLCFVTDKEVIFRNIYTSMRVEHLPVDIIKTPDHFQSLVVIKSEGKSLSELDCIKVFLRTGESRIIKLEKGGPWGGFFTLFSILGRLTPPKSP